MVGYSRDPAIRYIDLSNVAQDRSLYFQSAYSSLDDVVRAPLSSEGMSMLDFLD